MTPALEEPQTKTAKETHRSFAFVPPMHSRGDLVNLLPIT